MPSGKEGQSMNDKDKALLAAAQAIEAEYREAMKGIVEMYRGLHLPKIDTSSLDAMRALFDNPELNAARATLEATLSKYAAQSQEIADALKGFEVKHNGAIAAITEEAGTMLQSFLDDLSIEDFKEGIHRRRHRPREGGPRPAADEDRGAEDRPGRHRQAVWRWAE